MMKPANVVHFLQKILKMKKESAALKTRNKNKPRPNQVPGAQMPFKEKKKSIAKKENFTKSEALQKLFDIAGDDWGVDKVDLDESFLCPKVLRSSKLDNLKASLTFGFIALKRRNLRIDKIFQLLSNVSVQDEGEYGDPSNCAVYYRSVSNQIFIHFHYNLNRYLFVQGVSQTIFFLSIFITI